jgi:hypothetical protein
VVARIAAHRLKAVRPGVRGRFDRAVARSILHPSLRQTVVALGAAMILASGPLVISWMRDPAEVPRFVVLEQLCRVLYSVCLVPIAAAEPFVSRAFALDDRGELLRLVRRNVIAAMGLLLVGGSMLVAFGGVTVAVWVGPAQFAGDAALLLFVLVYVLETHHVVLGNVTFATGKITFVTPAVLAGVLTIAFGVALVPRFGVTGMITATLLAQLMTNNWYVPFYTLRRLSVSGMDYARWLTPLAPLALASIVAVPLGRFVVGRLSVPPLVSLVLGVAGTTLLMAPAGWRVAKKLNAPAHAG